MLLNRRIKRDLKSNMLQNIGFVLLIILSVMIIIGFNRSMDGYITTVNTLYEDYNVEDGQFKIFGQLSKRQKNTIKKDLNIIIEENKSVDVDLNHIDSDNDKTLRVMSGTKDINALCIIEGQSLKASNDIVLEPKFAQAQGYKIGDAIKILGRYFNIVGYGISPDYVYTVKNTSDFLNNPMRFGVGYVMDIDKVIKQTDIYSTYSFDLNEDNAQALKTYLRDETTLIEFMLKDDNPRITTVFDDVNSPKKLSIIMGILLLIIVSFMISLSIINIIKEESQTIGILYSQGFNKKELLRHYMIMPCILVVMGTLLGYEMGTIIAKPLTNIQTEYNIPEIQFEDAIYLLVFGIGVPILITIIITYLAIGSSLNQTPLSLLRGQHTNKKVSIMESKLTFKAFSFFLRFRLKGIIREKGSMLVLLLGVFLSTLILNTAFYMRDSSDRYVASIEKELSYNYMYTLKDSSLQVEGTQAEKSSIKNMKLQYGTQYKNVVYQGLDKKTVYFDLPKLDTLQENEVIIASCIRDKFNIHIGDMITLIDDLEDETYQCIVKDVIPYNLGQYIFTSKAHFNQMLDYPARAYNTLISQKDLDIDEENIYAIVSKQEVIDSAGDLLAMIQSMSMIMIIVAIIILMVVIYMLMKMIIDKSVINISMVKIFGYTQKEIAKLYLRGNILVILLAFLMAVPVAKLVAKKFYDGIFMNLQQYFTPYISLKSILIAFALTIISYLISCCILKRCLNKVILIEVIKNRE